MPKPGFSWWLVSEILLYITAALVLMVDSSLSGSSRGLLIIIVVGILLFALFLINVIISEIKKNNQP